MKIKDLPKEYGLYKSIDLEKDQRINIFCKAGGGLIFFTLMVVGYFINNQTLFFEVKDNPYALIQYISLIVCFILYSILHEFVHFIASKIKKTDSKWIRDGISPFVSLENNLLDNKTYYFIIFAPLVVFTIILIPLQIIITIFFKDWFFLVWTVIMQHFASSLTDLVAYFYTRKFKNAFLEDSNNKIAVYLPIEKFSFYHEMEKEIYRKKKEKQIKKKKRKQQFKYAPKIGKQKYLDELKEKSSYNQDYDDLSKLDM